MVTFDLLQGQIFINSYDFDWEKNLNVCLQTATECNILVILQEKLDKACL